MTEYCDCRRGLGLVLNLLYWRVEDKLDVVADSFKPGFFADYFDNYYYELHLGIVVPLECSIL